MAVPDYPPTEISISRERMRAECPRQYWYRYVGHWKGWMESAPEATQLAYLAGKRDSVATWLGKKIHEGISDYLASDLDITVIARRLSDAMRAEYQTSRTTNLRLLSSSKTFGLIDHFWGQVVPEEVVDEQVAKLIECLNALAAPTDGSVDFRDLVRRTRREGRYVEVEQPAQSDFASFKFTVPEIGLHIPIYAKPDLILNTGAGVLLLDWKTGHPPDGTQDRLSDQLRVYALRCRERPMHDALRDSSLEAYDFFLPGLAWSGGEFLAEDLDAARNLLKKATDEVTALLGRNTTIPREAMPPQPSANSCRHCVFRGMCPDRAT